MAGLVRAARPETLRLLDGAVLLWMTFWLAIGGWTAVSLWDLSDLGTTLSQSGQALDTAGEGLQRIGQIPVIGDRPEQLGNEVRRTAAEVTVRGAETRRNMRRLSLLLGVSIALIPSAPVLGVYLPRRLSRRRVARDVRRRVAARPHDPGLDRYLAQQAVSTIPLTRLLDWTDDPCGDLSDGRFRSLADAELQHLGISR